MEAMPIEVDTSEAPAFLRYRYTGPYPSIEEQALVRDRLIADGHLTRDTVALMDARQLEEVPDDDVLLRTVAAALQRGGWPRRRAYLIDPARHAQMIEQFKQLAMTTVTTAAFTDEREALAWLNGNPR
jgi:hypothetical protein